MFTILTDDRSAVVHLPSGTIKNTMEVLEGEWMKDKGGFRGIITRKVCEVE